MKCRTCKRRTRNGLMFCRRCFKRLPQARRDAVVKSRHCRSTDEFRTIEMAGAEIESSIIFENRLGDETDGGQ